VTGGSITSQKGFSLLEVLVAFSIMAMSLGFIYKAMGSNARSVGDLALRQQATMLAESVLLTRDSVNAKGWNESGVSGVFSWRVSSQPFAHSGQSAQTIESVNWIPLHQIQIDVSWSDGSKSRQLEVKTLLPQRKPLPGESIQ
jgi:general secretion pathway protein I